MRQDLSLESALLKRKQIKMIKKTLLFVTGVAVGVYSVPMAIIYVKPFQKVLVKSFTKFTSDKLEEDPEFRKTTIELVEKTLVAMKAAYPDE